MDIIIDRLTYALTAGVAYTLMFIALAPPIKLIMFLLLGSSSKMRTLEHYNAAQLIMRTLHENSSPGIRRRVAKTLSQTLPMYNGVVRYYLDNALIRWLLADPTSKVRRRLLNRYIDFMNNAGELNSTPAGRRDLVQDAVLWFLLFVISWVLTALALGRNTAYIAELAVFLGVYSMLVKGVRQYVSQQRAYADTGQPLQYTRSRGLAFYNLLCASSYALWREYYEGARTRTVYRDSMAQNLKHQYNLALFKMKSLHDYHRTHGTVWSTQELAPYQNVPLLDVNDNTLNINIFR